MEAGNDLPGVVPVMRATLPGTGNAYGPILWRARVASGRRNARKGVGSPPGLLEVRANPAGNRAPLLRPDRPRQRGVKILLFYR